MRVKMIATDLDGTLLRDDKTVSEYTASVFRRCSETGIKIVFATARPLRTVKIMNIDIKRDAVIYHNGAVIEIDGTVCFRRGIPHETAKMLLLRAADEFKDMKISVEIDDSLYSNFDVANVWPGEFSVLSDFKDLPKTPADKIIFGTAEGRLIEKIKKMLPDGLHTIVSENRLLMVMNDEACKSKAVVKIAEHYGVSLEETVAFGDDSNDINMLKYCANGVAVENAIDEAKAAAKFICGSNEDDGVAKWIEERVLA